MCILSFIIRFFFFFSFSLCLPTPSFTLFPYTTLFRSDRFFRCPVHKHGASGFRIGHNSWFEPFGLALLDGDAVAELGSFRSEEHTSELQSRGHLVCRLLLEKNKLVT